MFSFGKTPAIAGLEGHVLFENSGSYSTQKLAAISKQALMLSAAAMNRHLDVTAASYWGLALQIHHVEGVGVSQQAIEAGGRFELLILR